MKDCVEHFFEGRNAWQIGLVGYFTRVRGLLTSLIITFITMGTPFWWPSLIPGKIQLDLRLLFLLSTLCVGTLATIGFYYLRRRSQRSLDIKHLLHEFAHFLRDNHTKLCKKSKNSTGKKNKKHDYKVLRLSAEKICERIKDYFERLTKDNTIEVAIRLARNVDKKNKKIGYVTVARSSGLNNNRYKTTECIAPDEGIPRFFADKDSQGILIYNDLLKAAEIGAYKTTKNDEKYSEEISTMMVAPLNAWDGKKEGMIGILYVTSRNQNIFSVIHVDSMRFVADIVAKAMSHSVNTLKAE